MRSHNAIAVIPARFDSSRFPGKLLADLGGRPLIQWAYESVLRAARIDAVYVVTDSERILRTCLEFGAEVILDPTPQVCGSDRVAALARQVEADLVINLQADEPMMDPGLVDALVERMEESGSAFASAVAPIRSMQDFLDPNVVKVVLDAAGDALYFSRAPIPRPRDVELDPGGEWPEGLVALKHIGIYAYRRADLLDMASAPRSPLEVQENLEQLRILQRGGKIRIIEWNYHGIGVDTLEDLERLRAELRELGAVPQREE